MISIADITIPADDFELSHLHRELSGGHIELERLVTRRGSISILFWVSQGTTECIVDALEASPHVEEAQCLTSDGDHRLFEARWNGDADGFLRTMVESNARLLDGESIDGGWEFRLQFRNQDAVDGFRTLCDETGIDVVVRRIYRPSYPEANESMSTEQREAIVTAFEHGYFDIPRQTSLAVLADSFDISDSAYSQRLRRGLAALIEETIFES
ncbi:helix-turn-helix domain-containing protein [Haloarcula marina]|uniref:helix-turn-helix domain-containing protein n=1 Tax=Haloarcula marina TaxID=2961574 RepID=UPI0020B6B9FA|nr:helix-turn-helix domain-containing protein [Halomicroarcula marina]